MRSLRLLFLGGIALLFAARCALYSDVSIGPLVVLPTKIDRGSDVVTSLRKADYLRALEMAPQIDAKPRKTAAELLALGSAELAAARYDDARRHLRAALDLNPFRTVYAETAWNLAQVEYMTNNFETALEWANTATQNGLTVLQWHRDYLAALSKVQVYRFSGLPSDELPLKIGRPDVPRIDARINRQSEKTSVVIDSGAVLSIMSERLAKSLGVKRLPVGRGVFYGLLGEPINVEFGLVDSLELGALVVENIPIAIMPDDKMRFLVTDKREFRIDFLLGANLLKEFKLELKFSRNRAIFTRLTSRDRVPAADQNLFFEGFRPHVRGTVNRHGWYVFVIDTGSEVTYLNETQLRALPVNTFAPRMHGATLQGLGGARKHGTKLEDVKVGVDKWEGTYRTIPLYVGDEEKAVGIVGENFLKNFDVVLDFGRMRVDLTRR
jgi:tetratricopeptide (TPR) repeat protein